MEPIPALEATSRSFGSRAACEKLRLLAAIRRAPRPGAKGLRRLRAALDFLRAYPDDSRVLGSIHETIAALPPAEPIVYAYSYGVVQRLARLLPGALEIEWDGIEDEGVLLETLDLVVAPGEAQGLEDIRLATREWFARCRPARTATDLGFLLSLLERSGLSPRVQEYLFERCDLPLRYRGPASCAIVSPAPRVRFQREEIDRSAFPIEPIIHRPLRRVRRGGQALIDVALQALCARKLEIYPLIHANPGDVTLADCGRGVRIALIGTRPAFRSPLESLYVFLVMKNGAPVAYGPAGVFLGCCEMGINLFPEFRGGEIRYLYAQFMRVLHHLLAVEHFFLTRYGMGEDNPEAIATGAFWFHRKLGFRATNPAVEALAREEEARMAARPGYRSDRRMLRRLSHTEASLDLSAARCRPLDLGRLGVAQSRFIAREFAGDRVAAEERCARRISRLLGAPAGSAALRALAPLLALIPDLARWRAREKAALARIVRAKEARSERNAARLFKAHDRLESALRSIAREMRDRD